MTTNSVESERSPYRSRTIGIIGAGNIGQALSRTALRAGWSVVIANSRGPDSLASVVATLGAGVSPGTVAEAAAQEIVAIAVPWASVPAAVDGLKWAGQVIIDTTNQWDAAEPSARTSSETVAGLVPGARLVKAANTLRAQTLAADPREVGGQRVLFLSGDDAGAKAAVAELFEAAGFFAIDVGELVTGGRLQQRKAPLSGHNLVRLPPVQ